MMSSKVSANYSTRLVQHRIYVLTREVAVQVSRARSSISAMKSVERRDFVKLAVALPFAPPLRSFAEVASPVAHHPRSA